MSKELVIDFSATGEVNAMHMDMFDLGFLGQKKVQRATEIKFDEETQKWGLFLPINEGAALTLWTPVVHGAGFDTYETARDFEVAWLNVCRYDNQDPHGLWAVWAMQAMRKIGKPVSVDEFFALAGPALN